MGQIKITSGKYKGRKIITPGDGTHPMGERERLALFNAIFDYLLGAKVLDAYAGSGALGIEALSRGAKEVTFVEKSPRAARVIRQNLASLSLTGEVLTEAVRDYKGERIFDVILVDPPYDNFKVEEVSSLARFLKNDGILVLSHPGEAPTIEGLKLVKSSHYAAAGIAIYKFA